MSLESITFIDIETVSQAQAFDYLEEVQANTFLKKFSKQIDELCHKTNDFDGNSLEYGNQAAKFYRNNAALYAEFSKVVCVCVGKMKAGKFWVRRIASKDEVYVLKALAESLEKSTVLCAHNGKELDYPYLMRRYIVNLMPIPPLLNTFGKKPWEVALEDTMVMWSGTQWNYKISLDLLCNILSIPSPKTLTDGAGVHEIYHGMYEVEGDQLPFDKEEIALDKISEYCAGDVVAAARCYARMKNLPAIDNVEYIKYVPPTTTNEKGGDQAGTVH